MTLLKCRVQTFDCKANRLPALTTYNSVATIYSKMYIFATCAAQLTVLVYCTYGSHRAPGSSM